MQGFIQPGVSVTPSGESRGKKLDQSLRALALRPRTTCMTRVTAQYALLLLEKNCTEIEVCVLYVRSAANKVTTPMHS